MAKMSRKKWIRQRCDTIVEMVHEHVDGNGDPLQKELDAMHGFLRTWEGDYGKEDDPRMSMIVGMVADLCAIVQAYTLLRDNPPSD